MIDPAEAGGGLLDVGVYSLHFANMITGKQPSKTVGMAAINTDCHHIMVDETSSYMLQYDNGIIAMLTGSIYTQMPASAAIYGSRGRIELTDFYKPSHAKVVYNDESFRIIESPVPQHVKGIKDEGYQYEIDHVNECLRKGIKESPIVPYDVTRMILNECDELRSQWGLKYPFE